jgi:hypothetical protein
MERKKKISVTQQMGLDSLALIKTPQLSFHQRNFFEPLSSEGFVLERIFLEVEGSQIEEFSTSTYSRYWRKRTTE